MIIGKDSQQHGFTTPSTKVSGLHIVTYPLNTEKSLDAAYWHYCYLIINLGNFQWKGLPLKKKPTKTPIYMLLKVIWTKNMTEIPHREHCLNQITFSAQLAASAWSKVPLFSRAFFPFFFCLVYQSNCYLTQQPDGISWRDSPDSRPEKHLSTEIAYRMPQSKGIWCDGWCSYALVQHAAQRGSCTQPAVPGDYN